MHSRGAVKQGSITESKFYRKSKLTYEDAAIMLLVKQRTTTMGNI